MSDSTTLGTIIYVLPFQVAHFEMCKVQDAKRPPIYMATCALKYERLQQFNEHKQKRPATEHPQRTTDPIILIYPTSHTKNS